MSNEYNILLIEDDMIDILTVEKVVRQLQITTSLSIAQNEEEVISYLDECKKYEPSVIFLDIDMDSMDCMSFLKMLRGNSDFQNVPVILLTSSEEKKYSYTNAHLGISGYMLKPIGNQQLRELISILNSSRSLSDSLPF